MTEYIKKEDVLSILSYKNAAWNSYTQVSMLKAENVVPRELYERALSDVIRLSTERKSGKWISMMGHSICNVCGYKASPILTNYCPNCGTSMKGE